jgi:hypothetical protein
MCRCCSMDWTEAEESEMVDEIGDLAEIGGLGNLDVGCKSEVSWSRDEWEGCPQRHEHLVLIVEKGSL